MAGRCQLGCAACCLLLAVALLSSAGATRTPPGQTGAASPERAAAPVGGVAAPGTPLDRVAQRWVDTTLKTLTTDQMAGQLLMARFAGVFTSSDSELPEMLLTYDFSDVAEESAVRAIAGEIAIGGRLPIARPGMYPVGHGPTRPAAGSQ